MERFPSGQRGQTVNLLAQPSKVRILLSPLPTVFPKGRPYVFYDGFKGMPWVLVFILKVLHSSVRAAATVAEANPVMSFSVKMIYSGWPTVWGWSARRS